MESGIIKWVVTWGLARLADRVTWATWISLGVAHFGIGVIDPQFESMLINIATAIVAVVGYAVEGKPLIGKPLIQKKATK